VWKCFQIAAFTLCIVLPVWGQTPPATGDDTYRLAPDDKLHIRVPALRNFVGEPQPEATALNDEFTVNPDGRLSLPLIGSVPAAGKTTEAVADEIADRLQTTVGMDRPPKISVEIAHFRPFYIVGAVNHPGEYPYRPGLTVLQALGIAGGLFRPGQNDAAQGSARPQQADLRFLLLQSNRLISHRARLQAELDGAKEVNFPPELTRRGSEPDIAEMLKQEGMAFAAYREGQESGIASRNQLKERLANEITSLQQKIGSFDQELALVKDEATKVTGLAAKGWVPAPQEIMWRQNVMGMQRQRLDLDTAMLRAREDIDKNDQGLVDLQNQTRREILHELDQTADKFSEVSARIAAITGVLRHDEAAMLELTASHAEEAPIVYTIVRRDQSGAHELEVSEMTLVQPGDTIRVKQQVTTASAPSPEVKSTKPGGSSPVPEAAKPQAKPTSQLQKPGRVSLVVPIAPKILLSGSETQPAAEAAGATLQNNTLELAEGARAFINNITWAIPGSQTCPGANNIYLGSQTGFTIGGDNVNIDAVYNNPGHNISYAIGTPCNRDDPNFGLADPAWSCTANKCMTDPLWINVGNTSTGSRSVPPNRANFALQSGSPAIGYGITQPYSSPQAADASACYHTITTCPN
jgi:protein involved in polysaccharide export with SLBB domain